MDTDSQKLLKSDDAHLAALYAEFAHEDRSLAEKGIEDYQRGLVGDDNRARRDLARSRL